MSNQYGHAQIVKDNLLLCLDANDVSSYPGTGTIWYDVSGNNNDVTLYGGPVYTAENGSYYLKFVPNDYGSRTNDGSALFEFTDTFTTCSFFRSRQSSTAWSFIHGFNDADDYNLFQRSGSRIFHNNGPVIEVAPDLYNIGWVYYCMVVDAGFASIYRKVYSDSACALVVGPNDLTGQWAAPAGNFQIAATNSGASYRNNIDFGNIQVYNRALSAAEICQNFEVQRSRFGL